MMCYMCVYLKDMNDILLIKEFVVMNVCIVIMNFKGCICCIECC